MKIFQKVSVFLVIFAFFAYGLSAAGRITVLTGTSSSGKSTISRKLNQMLIGSKLLSLDGVYWNLRASGVERALKQNNFDIKFPRNDQDAIVRKLRMVPTWICFDAFRTGLMPTSSCSYSSQDRLIQEAKQLAIEGHDVIIDTVIFNLDDLKAYREAFNGIETKFILVYCPVEVLQSRVNSRNKSLLKRPGEARQLESVLIQFSNIYKIDSVSNGLFGQVSRDTINNLFEANQHLKVLRDREGMCDIICKRLGFCDDEKIGNIASRWSYDFVVSNAQSGSTARCAREIKQFLPKRNIKDILKTLPIVGKLFSRCS